MFRGSGSTRAWTVVVVALVCCLATGVTGSAIPMWEFLTRDEKMSHLYKIFSKQVASYCTESPLPDCNKNMLVSGIRSLASMDDNQLDRMDPYQRGANDIIWRSVIGENRLTSRLGHEDSYYAVGADPLATSGSDDNGLGGESAPVNDYLRPSDHSGPYLVGPMVIRVFPDGRPVPGDAERPLPQDEDVDELKYSRIPSVTEIEASSERFFYKKPTYHVNANKRGVYVHSKPVQRDRPSSRRPRVLIIAVRIRSFGNAGCPTCRAKLAPFASTRSQRMRRATKKNRILSDLSRDFNATGEIARN